MKIFVTGSTGKLGSKCLTLRKRQMKSPNRGANWVAASSAVLAFLLWTPAPRLLAQAKAIPPAPLAQAKATGTVTVLITAARSARGKMIVWLFKDAQGFPNDTSKIFRQQSVGIDPNTKIAQVTFKNLPQGTFAVTVLHDENNNGKMDKNFFGMPKEGYGASNNPKKRMRAANFDEAKFSLNASEQTIKIALIYW